MADYWKSTPKYWCKHCKLFVRDTPLEKRNHEASPRHQGNLQRFVKELHKSNAREERDAQRAKDEAARLNGVQPGAFSSTGPPQRGTASSTGGSAPKQAPKATVEDRRRQMAQLAALGVVVPEGFRNENAMAGDWETVAVHPTARGPQIPPKSRVKKEEDSDDDVKPGLADPSLTERKRKLAEGDAELDSLTQGKRKPNWGSDVKTQREVDADDDLDALLAGSSKVIGKSAKKARIDEGELAEDSATAEDTKILSEGARDDSKEIGTLVPAASGLEDGETDTKEGDDDIGSMFKKRKKKALKADG